jgi:hypothetical protein
MLALFYFLKFHLRLCLQSSSFNGFCVLALFHYLEFHLGLCLRNLSSNGFCVLAPVQHVFEAARPDEGFYIRSGITVVCKNAVIKHGTVI